jgi:hypothetical protein
VLRGRQAAVSNRNRTRARTALVNRAYTWAPQAQQNEPATFAHRVLRVARSDPVDLTGPGKWPPWPRVLRGRRGGVSGPIEPGAEPTLSTELTLERYKLSKTSSQRSARNSWDSFDRTSWIWRDLRSARLIELPLRCSATANQAFQAQSSPRPKRACQPSSHPAATNPANQPRNVRRETPRSPPPVSGTGPQRSARKSGDSVARISRIWRDLGGHCLIELAPGCPVAAKQVPQTQSHPGPKRAC